MASSSVKEEYVARNTDDERRALLTKSVKFWKHPSMAGISVEEKKDYLKSRGLTDEDIYQVWEQLVEEHDTTRDETTTTRTETPALLRHDMPMSSYPPPQPVLPPYNTEMSQFNNNNNHQDIPILLTVGGILGLTAAAAIRWLNGGDFCLLPPPTTNTMMRGNEVPETTRDPMASNNTESRVIEDQDDGQNDGVADEEEDITRTTKTNDDQLLSMQQLLHVLETHVGTQERIVQQLSNHATKQVTDQSMQVLRNSLDNKNSSSLSSVAQQQEQLQEILSIMKNLDSQAERWSSNDADLQTRLLQVLQQLEAYLKNNTVPRETDRPTTDDSSDSHLVTIPIVDLQEPNITTTPTSTCNTTVKTQAMRDAIQTLANDNDATQLRAGAQVLYLYVVNLSSHPHVPRYRKIFTSNESFQKVTLLKGGKELLLAIGFVDKPNHLEWQGGEEDMQCLKEAAAALSILKSPHYDDNSMSSNALSVFLQRPSTPPPEDSLGGPLLQTPHFIVSPPNTKKHPLLTVDGGDLQEDSVLDLSTASEQFESRLEALTQPVINAAENTLEENGAKRNVDDSSSIPKSNLSMRETTSSSDIEQEENDEK